LGLPLNLYVAAVILLNSHLRNRPRYILQLNIVFICNLLTLFTDAEEAVYYYLPSDELCQSFVFTFVFPYFLFNLNVFLSLLCRCIAIDKPLWHRANVSPRFVVVGSLIVNLVLVLALNWAYIGGVVPLRCAFSKHFTKGGTGLGVILFTLCVVFIIVVYVKTRQHLPRPSIIVPVARTLIIVLF